MEAPPWGRGDPESQYEFWMARGHPGWVVLNRGVNRERTETILQRFRRDVLDEAPKYVVILGGVNDVYQGLPAERASASLSTMYQWSEEAGIRAIAASILPYNGISRAQAEEMARLNRWIGEEASRRRMRFCDTNRLVADPTEPNRLASTSDGLHPDVAGYRKMGEALARVVESEESR